MLAEALVDVVHVTDYTIAVGHSAGTHAVHSHGYQTSSSCAGHVPPCIDEDVLRMVSTTSLHPMKCGECTEHRRTLPLMTMADTANSNVFTPVPPSSTASARHSAVGFTSPSGVAKSSRTQGAARTPQGSIFRSPSIRGQRASIHPTAGRGPSLTPVMSDGSSRPTALFSHPTADTSAAQTSATCTTVAVPVTAQHILEGANRVFVLGYEDGSVRLVHLHHQENRDDGLPRAASAPTEASSDVRHWSLTDLFHATTTSTPAMSLANTRGTEHAVDYLDTTHPSTARGSGWSPVVGLHAVPCSLNAPSTSPSPPSQSGVVDVGAESAPVGALTAVAYQDRVLVMMEPLVEVSASLSSRPRRRPVAAQVRVVVSAAMLRDALYEALSGRAPDAASSASSSPNTHPSGAAGSGAQTSRPGPTSTLVAANTTPPTATFIAYSGPLSVSGVRVSPCGTYLAVHLIAPMLCVLVFELPSFYTSNTVDADNRNMDDPTSTAAAMAAPPIVMRPPTRLVAGCRYESASSTASLTASNDETGVTVSESPSFANPIYAESFFVTSAPPADVRNREVTACQAGDSVLMVVWVQTRCFTRLALPQAAAQTTRDLQRALEAASTEAIRHRGAFDSVDVMRAGGRCGSAMLSHSGRPASQQPGSCAPSARRERLRQSVAAGSAATGTSLAPPSVQSGSSGAARPRPASSGGVMTADAALTVFARAQTRYTAQIIECTCGVRGDSRLVLLGLSGGMVQVLDAQTINRALFSVTPPYRIPLTASEALHRERTTLRCASASSAAARVNGAGAEVTTAGVSVMGSPSFPTREPDVVAAAPTPDSITAARPAPMVTAITFLQAFTDEEGALVVVASTTTRTVCETRADNAMTSSLPPSPPLRARPTFDASAINARLLPEAASTTRAPPPSRMSASRRATTNANQTKLPVSSLNTSAKVGLTEVPDDAPAEETERPACVASPATLTVHGAAVVSFSPHQRSTPSVRCYLTHLPSPARALIPLHPLPAALVSLSSVERASGLPSPLATSTSGLDCRQGNVTDLSPIAGCGAGTRMDLANTTTTTAATPSTSMTLWWDVVQETIIGSVPCCRPHLTPGRTVLESTQECVGSAAPIDENTATELTYSGRLGTGTPGTNARSARLASTATSLSGTVRRQLSRAQRKGEADATTSTAPLSLALARHRPSPAFAWCPTSHARSAAGEDTTSTRAAAQLALEEGPAVMWLEDGSHETPVTPMCWPIQALVSLVYPAVTSAYPTLPLTSVARVLRTVPPHQRHDAARHRQSDHVQAEIGVPPRPRPKSGGSAGMGADREARATPELGVRPPSCSHASTLHLHTDGGDGSLPTTADGRKSTLRTRLPAANRTVGRPGTGGARRGKQPPTTHAPLTATTTPPYRSGRARSPHAWLTTLEQTAADRQKQLDSVIAQWHTSRM